MTLGGKMEKRTEKLAKLLDELNVDGIFLTDLYNLRVRHELPLPHEKEIFSILILDTEVRLKLKFPKWDLNLRKFQEDL